MKIQEVTIEGYQSHVHSTFRISPGLTVVTGPSDAGKTAIIRALRWFAFNEPTGEAFLHTIRNADGSIKEAADHVKVSVTFDNGTTITKTRRKGKTTYTHSSFPSTWEKAEIPPEIKETLGLFKQSYGDFETCLNFAFQLDAPFMLSETASVGAKVLGKLAGTEIVDKSISEVNKKTHKTRTDISYADRQIGEIDVALTEYFDLDRHDTQLQAAEASYEKLTKARERYLALVDLASRHEYTTKRLVEQTKAVERFDSLIAASVALSLVERYQGKKDKLEDLTANFWKAVNAQNEPLKVLRLTRNLEELKENLLGTAKNQEALEKLLGNSASYYHLMNEIADAQDALERYTVSDTVKTVLDSLAKESGRQDDLERLQNAYKVLTLGIHALEKKAQETANMDVLQAHITAAKVLTDQLEKLKSYQTIYGLRRRELLEKEVDVSEAQKAVDLAKTDLHTAWEEAGGVCPLCGSEV